jgi:hypothetical protein
VGLEAKCQLRVGRAVHEGKALLETDDLLFRGDVRLKIPLTSIKTVTAADGVLQVDHTEGRAAFNLGPAADRWAERIRSPRTLIDKLDIKPGALVSVLGVTDAGFLAQLAARTPNVSLGKLNIKSAVILLAVEKPRDIDKIQRVAEKMARTAMLWVVHPKGVNGVKDTDIFAACDTAGLTYTKVARFSATHTAEKLVVPVSMR